MKRIWATLMAAMVCCATTPSAAVPVGEMTGALGLARSTPNGDAAVADVGRAPSRASDRPGRVRPLGAAGGLCILLTALGGFAVTVAGCLLLRNGRTDRDGRYILLGMAGHGMLVTAAFGLILLNW